MRVRNNGGCGAAFLIMIYNNRFFRAGAGAKITVVDRDGGRRTIGGLARVITGFATVVSAQVPSSIISGLGRLGSTRASSVKGVVCRAVFSGVRGTVSLGHPTYRSAKRVVFFIGINSHFPLLNRLRDVLGRTIRRTAIGTPLHRGTMRVFSRMGANGGANDNMP